MTESVGHRDPPVPVMPAVGLGIAGNDQSRCFHITRLVENPKVKIKVRPVIWKGFNNAVKFLKECHRVTG